MSLSVKKNTGSIDVDGFYFFGILNFFPFDVVVVVAVDSVEDPKDFVQLCDQLKMATPKPKTHKKKTTILDNTKIYLMLLSSLISTPISTAVLRIGYRWPSQIR